MPSIILAIKKILLEGPRSLKVVFAVTSDLMSIILSLYLAYRIGGNSFFIEFSSNGFFYTYSLFLVMVIFFYNGVYKTILRYIDIAFLFLLIKSLLTSIILIVTSAYLLKSVGVGLFYKTSILMIDGWFVVFMLSLSLILSSRVLGNAFFLTYDSSRKVIIYGAGSAGMQLANAMKAAQKMKVVAFVDDNKLLQGNFIGEIKVHSPKKLNTIINKEDVDEILVAMPSLSSSSINLILKDLEKYATRVRLLPSVYELTQGKNSLTGLKEVNGSDLLGRAEVESYSELLEENIKHKNILVTGAGGSIGSEISRQILKNNPNRLILLDSSEYNLYKIREETELLKGDIEVFSILSDVKERKKLNAIMETFNVNTIYHAAAYKHVPMVEENSFEAVSNNIFGTKSCIDAAIEAKVETFVLISTDKAVRPTNIMGATKRYSEMILQCLANDKSVSTKITMVRFGNVIGSSGSAIPLFQKQIQEGGPITVTHPEVTRYFMSIPEAAELVIQAGALGKGGDVFVLDMGKPIKIIDLAKRLIRLSGKTIKNEDNPLGDIEIVFTGLRPGEKLYEELLIGKEIINTKHKHIFRAEEEYLTKAELDNYLMKINHASLTNDVLTLKAIFKESINGYEADEANVDLFYKIKNQA